VLILFSVSLKSEISNRGVTWRPTYSVVPVSWHLRGEEVGKTNEEGGTQIVFPSFARRIPHSLSTFIRIARSKRDGTRAETRFGISAKRTSPFKSAGVSVQSTTGSRGVRISGQRLYRPCSDVQCEAAGYPLHSHLSPSLPPPPRVTVCDQVPNAPYLPNAKMRELHCTHRSSSLYRLYMCFCSHVEANSVVSVASHIYQITYAAHDVGHRPYLRNVWEIIFVVSYREREQDPCLASIIQINK